MYFRIDRVNLSFRQFVIALGISTITALLGARLVFIIAMLPQMELSINNIIHYTLNGGIVFYGGMLGALAGIPITSRIIGCSSKMVTNMAAPAIPLFHFWARIGCLFAGCCYGIPWPWGVVMQDSAEIIRFPVQFVESICNLVIFVIVIFVEKKSKSYDHNISIYLILYSVCRFILEFFRGDEVRGIWMFGLSTAQIISVLIVGFIVTNKFLVKYMREPILRARQS